MNDIDLVILDTLYNKTLKLGRILYDEAAASESIEMAGKLEAYAELSMEMNNKLENILNLSTKYAHECLHKATNIRKRINIIDNCEGSSYDKFKACVKLYDGIQWSDIQEQSDIRDKLLTDVDAKIERKSTKKLTAKNSSNKKSEDRQHISQPTYMYKTMSDVYDKPLGFEWKVPIINKLSELPSSLYWYKGGSSNPPGLYMCITRGFYTQVPFPNVIDATQNFNRTGSIKCKYNTIEDCLSFRRSLASKYNSDVRECNFAHAGDQYIKLGTTFRCPHKPRFGNHNHLTEDINNVSDSDIKTMLMYSLSDILLSSIWFQRTKTGDEKSNMILSNIDIC